MTAHPQPPADLATRRPKIRTLKAGTRAYGFHAAAHGPIHFDRGRGGRLNAADGSCGVLYLALSPAGAFAEAFLRTPGRTLLDPDLIAAKAYAEVATTRGIEAIELRGPGSVVLGATAELTYGPPPYDVPQMWSLVGRVAGLFSLVLAGWMVVGWGAWAGGGHGRPARDPDHHLGR